MMDSGRVQQWWQRLQNARRRGRTAQTQALLAAFAAIDDVVLREQVVVLLEVISANPELSARMKAFGGNADEPASNVVYLNPAT
jgi:hypothetical protein